MRTCITEANPSGKCEVGLSLTALQAGEFPTYAPDVAYSCAHR